ncbi:hypothetical protein TSUD_216310 [Trifolium subterraneum]|uniref:Reverse transcriptase domain-containing protein n=1 Tax=Trifolium subterraneum TaxID=3900 RepID=A0A2Z6MKC1_TRISU|nr:hypothetical protein TSUD_216310 [Trifolium subterraneum]
MTQPSGFTISGASNLVCRLRRSLYGLKQSPRASFGRFSNVLQEYGITRCEDGYSIFFLHSSQTTCIYLLVYVDNIIITGNDTDGIQRCSSKIGVAITQRKYALDILEETSLLDYRPCDTPIDPNVKLLPGQGEPLKDPDIVSNPVFHESVGSLRGGSQGIIHIGFKNNSTSRLSIQGASSTLCRTIGSDTTVGSLRGGSQGIIHIGFKNNSTNIPMTVQIPRVIVNMPRVYNFLGYGLIVSLDYGKYKPYPYIQGLNINDVEGSGQTNATLTPEELLDYQGFNIRPMEDNKFMFQFFHPWDMERIYQGGPWLFENHMLILRKVQFGEDPTTVPMDLTEIWVQIYHLPFGFMCKPIGYLMGSHIGNYVKYDDINNCGSWMKYMRLWVAINVNELLEKSWIFERGGGEAVQVHFKYEKLGNFCFVCGIIGHTENFCSKRFEADYIVGEKGWGNYLRAENGGATANKWLRNVGSSDRGGREGAINAGFNVCEVNALTDETFTKHKIHGGVKISRDPSTRSLMFFKQLEELLEGVNTGNKRWALFYVISGPLLNAHDEVRGNGPRPANMQSLQLSTSQQLETEGIRRVTTEEWDIITLLLNAVTNNPRIVLAKNTSPPINTNQLLLGGGAVPNQDEKSLPKKRQRNAEFLLIQDEATPSKASDKNDMQVDVEIVTSRAAETCWVKRGQPGIIHIGFKNNSTSELDTTLLPKTLSYTTLVPPLPHCTQDTPPDHLGQEDFRYNEPVKHFVEPSALIPLLGQEGAVLKVLDLWVLLLIKCSTSTILSNDLDTRPARKNESHKLELSGFREGRGGGIAMLWKISLKCQITKYSLNHIDLEVSDDVRGNWRITGFYGFPEGGRRRESWNFLCQLSQTSQLPWCIIGDYNDILSFDEKKGRSDRPNWLINDFRDAVLDAGLIDIELIGYPFTWFKSLGTDRVVEEKLDRALANVEWCNLFIHAKLECLTSTASDHYPLLLSWEQRTLHSKPPKQFKFENSWLIELDFDQFVRQYWNSSVENTITHKLNNCATTLSEWSNENCHKTRRDIENYRQKLETARTCVDESNFHYYNEIRKKLDFLLAKDDLFWKKRGKTFWYRDDDLNTRFFHATTSAIKRKNQIERIEDIQGNVCTSIDGMKIIAKEYFMNLLQQQNGERMRVVDAVNSCISLEDNNILTAPFSLAEFKIAGFSMEADKCPGPDGFNPGFYQHFWELCGHEIYNAACAWLPSGDFPPNLNSTNIALIPKGRSILDNAMTTIQIIHHMKSKTRGKKGDVALKLDISKAYDRIDWEFLRDMMSKMGFSQQWIDWIMLCVEIVDYSVIVNGHKVGPVVPDRGLRQGDPLSPYLFIICAEGLSALIRQAEARKGLHGIKICRNAPTISHLLFADDCFLFFKATINEATVLKNILDVYEVASGQAINLQKSEFYCNRNVNPEIREAIANHLEVAQVLGTGKYLSLPSMIGMSKKSTFKFIKDRIWRKVNSWSSRHLSQAGREVMIKSILQSIPTYVMSVFLLPSTLNDEIEKMINSLWWGHNGNNNRGLHWLSWERLSVSKDQGGMGFKNLQAFNLAMLGKQAWNLVTKPSSLITKLLKAQCYPKSDFFESSIGHNPSYIWRSIWNSKSIIKDGCRWSIGTGERISIWEQNWLSRKDLMLENAKAWNYDKIINLFDNNTVSRIMQTPLFPSVHHDTLAWKLEQDGIYSVCSAYKLCVHAAGVNDRHGIVGNWNIIWREKIPPKVKNLMWRIGRNILPTRARLINRGVQCPVNCALCNNNDEDIMHVFFWRIHSYIKSTLDLDSDGTLWKSESLHSEGVQKLKREFRSYLLVKSYSEDEEVQKLKYEGLSEANYSRPIRLQRHQRFIRSKGNSPSHQKGYINYSYQA